jgi:hypothetical protein
LYADPDPDPTAQINADPCGSGSGYGSETLLVGGGHSLLCDLLYVLSELNVVQKT